MTKQRMTKLWSKFLLWLGWIDGDDLCIICEEPIDCKDSRKCTECKVASAEFNRELRENR